MSKRLYVGNLDFKVDNDQLKKFFDGAGKVDSAEVVVKPMGFGFVEMASEEDAKKAIEMLNGKKLLDREVRVDFAKERDVVAENAEVPVEQPVIEEAPMVEDKASKAEK